MAYSTRDSINERQQNNSSKQTANAQFFDHRAISATQLKQQAHMAASPTATAQRAAVNAMNTSAVQQQKIIQRVEPEEKLQMKANPQTTQLAGMNEEELLQGKFETAQVQRAVIQMEEDDDESSAGGGRTGIMGEKLPGMMGEGFNILAVIPTFLPEVAQPYVNMVAGSLLLGSAGYQYLTSKDEIEKIQAGANASAAGAQLLQGVLQHSGYVQSASVVGYFPNLLWAMSEACNTFYNYHKYTGAMSSAGAFKAVGALANTVSSAGKSDIASYSTAAVAILGAAIAGGSHALEICRAEKKEEDGNDNDDVIDVGSHLNPAGDNLYGTV